MVCQAAGRIGPQNEIADGVEAHQENVGTDGRWPRGEVGQPIYDRRNEVGETVQPAETYSLRETT
jgi:hypothetical protein